MTTEIHDHVRFAAIASKLAEQAKGAHGKDLKKYEVRYTEEKGLYLHKNTFWNRLKSKFSDTRPEQRAKKRSDARKALYSKLCAEYKEFGHDDSNIAEREFHLLGLKTGQEANDEDDPVASDFYAKYRDTITLEDVEKLQENVEQAIAGPKELTEVQQTEKMKNIPKKIFSIKYIKSIIAVLPTISETNNYAEAYSTIEKHFGKTIASRIFTELKPKLSETSDKTISNNDLEGIIASCACFRDYCNGRQIKELPNFKGDILKYNNEIDKLLINNNMIDINGMITIDNIPENGRKNFINTASNCLDIFNKYILEGGDEQINIGSSERKNIENYHLQLNTCISNNDYNDEALKNAIGLYNSLKIAVAAVDGLLLGQDSMFKSDLRVYRSGMQKAIKKVEKIELWSKKLIAAGY
jgi:hypothetical protein